MGISLKVKTIKPVEFEVPFCDVAVHKVTQRALSQTDYKVVFDYFLHVFADLPNSYYINKNATFVNMS